MSGNELVRQVRTPAGDPAWQIRGHDLVRTMLADQRLGRSHPDPAAASKYSDASIFGQAFQATGTVEQERAEHAMMRRLLAGSFSARRLAYLKPRIEDLVSQLLDQIGHTPRPVDLHEALAFPLPTLVICELLGVPYADRDAFRTWSDDAADMTDATRSNAGLSELKAYMRDLLDAKRTHPEQDVLTDLVGAQQHSGGLFTDQHVVDLAAGLLFAGHETTVAAIDRGVVLFLTHPDQLALLLEHPELTPTAVEEILRSANPVHADKSDLTNEVDGIETGVGLTRYANATIELDGIRIAPGDMVLLDLDNANADPAAFTAPERFDIRRDPNPHVTLGHGPHFCLGAPLARIELTAVFGTLFTRFPSMRLAVPFEQLRPRAQLLTGGLTALPVTW